MKKCRKKKKVASTEHTMLPVPHIPHLNLPAPLTCCTVVLDALYGCGEGCGEAWGDESSWDEECPREPRWTTPLFLILVVGGCECGWVRRGDGSVRRKLERMSEEENEKGKSSERRVKEKENMGVSKGK